MINKILGNLPFNPSLISQVSFYAKRLRQESSIRRLGLVLVVLSMFVQMGIAISPPQRSFAYSDNNLINGIKTRTDILNAWNKSGSDIPAIYEKFGVTKADIEALPLNPNTTIKSDAQDYWSVGRLSLSGFSNVNQQYKNTEIAINAGPTTIYMRQLRAWDIKNPYNVYKAWQGKKANGETFWIIMDCGNYVQVGKVVPSKPVLELRKTIPGNTGKYKSGDTFTFRIEYRNKAEGSLAENTVLSDLFDLTNIEIINPSNLTLQGSLWRVPIGNLAYSQSFHVIDVTVKLKQTVADLQKICNNAELTAGNAPPVSSNVCTDTAAKEKIEVATGKSKTVKNITQNLSGDEALSKPAKPDDIIEYTLLTSNSGTVDKLHYVVEDYVGDLLDYAELDMPFLASQGGVYEAETKKIFWRDQTIKAGSEITKIFRIKMKNPVPSTNSPSAITTTFDCKISNEYGNEQSMDVVCPYIKNIERLPNTGPGETLAIAFGVTTFAAYFFARSRLLAKEMEIIKQDYSTGGGA